MELCSGGHGTKAHTEICYEGRGCPLCKKWEELAVEIDELKGEIYRLEEEAEK